MQSSANGNIRCVRRLGIGRWGRGGSETLSTDNDVYANNFQPKLCYVVDLEFFY